MDLLILLKGLYQSRDGWIIGLGETQVPGLKPLPSSSLAWWLTSGSIAAVATAYTPTYKFTCLACMMPNCVWLAARATHEKPLKWSWTPRRRGSTRKCTAPTVRGGSIMHLCCLLTHYRPWYMEPSNGSHDSHSLKCCRRGRRRRRKKAQARSSTWQKMRH